MEIRRIEIGDRRWPAFVEHLERAEQRRWVLDDAGELVPDLHALAAIEDGKVVGNLVLKAQPIEAPPTAWSGDVARSLRGSSGDALRETYVQTFHVEAAYRRRGVGRALQEAALGLTRQLGCLQMRSWSSLDRDANHALKLGMGFALHPEVHQAASGLEVSGFYFVKRVDGDAGAAGCEEGPGDVRKDGEGP